MIYLEFIFQSFWHFIGTLLLCGAVFGGIGSMFSSKIVYKNCKEEEDL